MTELEKYIFDSSKYIKLGAGVRRDIETGRLVSDNLNKEKESLVCKYLEETGLNPSELCIVTKNTSDGFIIFVDKIKNHIRDI